MDGVTSIQRNLDEYPRAQAAEAETDSIPRVREQSRGFRQGLEKSYEPCVISIGPYHWGMPHLNYMQKHKWQCLRDIFKDRHLNDLIEELKSVENRARSFYPESRRSFYPESRHRLNKRDFLEMLLLDGCFIVHYLDRALSLGSKPKIWSDRQICNDLLLLENQLPFFVVQCIYRLVKQTDDNQELIETAVKFFQNLSPKKLGVCNPEIRNFKHLLHLYHAYLFFDEHEAWEDIEASQVWTIPSAILLQEAGIKFMQKKPLDKAINVKFSAGVMTMPPLVIDAFSISLFLNLIEFERAHPDMEPRFTAFLQFLDCIINTAEDVALLRKNGILNHAFGSDEEVAGIFNRLTSGTFHQQSWELKRVYIEMDKHYKNKWNHWGATLLRDYFGSPFAGIAFLAAVLLLSFAFIQTFFSAYSYFRPSSAS